MVVQIHTPLLRLKKRDVIELKAGVILGHLKYDLNEGTIMRSAEAFGLNTVFYYRKPSLTGGCGSEKHLNYFKFPDDDKLLEYLMKNNYSLVSIENCEDSVSIHDVKKYPPNPVFITGHENTGVSSKFLNNSRLIVKIPQANTYVRCLNTAVACGIVFQDFYNKHVRGLIRKDKEE